MASTSSSYSSILSISLESPTRRRCCSKNQAVALNPSPFLSSNLLLKLKIQILRNSTIQLKCRKPRTQGVPIVYAAQSNFFKIIQRVWTVGKDGIDAATNLVPDSIPRPITRISVTVVALTLAFFVLKSFLSTVFFVAAMMGLIYFTFIALNKDEGPRADGESTSVEDSLEEARKIMDKYK